MGVEVPPKILLKANLKLSLNRVSSQGEPSSLDSRWLPVPLRIPRRHDICYRFLLGS